MITPKTILVGNESVDITEGTGSSAVTLSGLVNGGKRRLWLGEEVGEGFPIEPGQGLPQGISTGPTDKLFLVREGNARSKPEPVHVILGHSA